ncbi:MAG: winged helix-turn-helix domain-containing protein [Chloroflexi bacterium]|nr:MAG: winged helix-turn-helix domain-containing protein [Chloroflexota bacterium]
MAPPLTISAAVARRFLVLRHLLAPPRSLPAAPESVMTVMGRLGSLQFDPLDIAGRNHDLVLLSRIAGYRRDWTDALLYKERRLYESYNKGLSVLPTTEMPWFRLTWDRSRARHEGSTFDEHSPLVAELLERIRRVGPLSSTDVEPRAAIDWYWRPTNQVRAILEALAEAGILGLSRREGNRRVYDLVERLFPGELLATRIPERDQLRHRVLSRYRAHGLLGASGQAEIWLGLGPASATAAANGTKPWPTTRGVLRQELIESGDLVAMAVEGIRGERYVVREELDLVSQAEREVERGAGPGGHVPGVAFLAPLDPLVWDRDLLRRLFGFDYIWEVYVPAAKRRHGYYVLPVLLGDRIVGRIEPRIDRRTNVLRIIGLWWEEGFDPLAERGLVDGLSEALEAHRRFGDARRIVLPRTIAHRPLVRALRKAVAV